MDAKTLFLDTLYCSKLVLESMGLVTQAVVKRQKAKSTFKKTLIHQGLTAEIATEIAREFPNPMTDFINLVKSSR